MDDEPTVHPPRKLLALTQALVSDATDGAGLHQALELAEELHGELGVWINRLRDERDHRIRDMHRRL